ncbi:MAG TPA: FcoT family thioesterase [Pseudonocardiaceae bacterium]
MRVTDAELLERALACYKPHCRYLRSAGLDANGPDPLVVRGRFAIPESCYIDDTGHLNSVEVNICVNQLLYLALAVVIRDRLAPAFADWTLGGYWERRLSDVLIGRYAAAFPRPIDAGAFTAELAVRSVRQRRLRSEAPPLVAVDLAFRCHDAAGGAAGGTVAVAVVGGPS